MAEADLDVVIRQLAKQQTRTLVAATKSRRDRYLGLAAKAKTKDAKARYKQMATDAMLHGAAAAKRLQISADNAADSYARSMRQAADAHAAQKPVVEKADKAAKTKTPNSKTPSSKTPPKTKSPKAKAKSKSAKT